MPFSTKNKRILKDEGFSSSVPCVAISALNDKRNNMAYKMAIVVATEHGVLSFAKELLKVPTVDESEYTLFSKGKLSISCIVSC